MAIIIPSKSIYSVENPKIRDNIINRIDIDCVEPTNPYITEKENVYSANISLKNEDCKLSTTKTNYDNYQNADAFNTDKIEEVFEVVGGSTWYTNLKSTIERYKDNYYIQKIFLNNITPTITYGITQTNVKELVSSAYYKNEYGAWVWDYWKITELVSKVVRNIDSLDYINSYGTPTYKTSSSERLDTKVKYKSVSLEMQDNSTLNEKGISKLETESIIDLDYKFLTKTKKLMLIGSFEREEQDKVRDVEFYGVFEEVTPQTLQFNIEGTTIGINLNDGTIQYGNGNNPFKIEKNELLQSINFYYKRKEVSINIESYYNSENGFVCEISTLNKLKIGDVLYYKNNYATIESQYYPSHTTNLYYYNIIVEENSDFLKLVNKSINVYYNNELEIKNALEQQYTNLLEQYKNGKETAVINCSISEYKDQDGNVVINPKTSEKMLFEMYDIVIPYKQGFLNGKQQDVPLSKYPNGEPKQFQVLGVKPHTSGVLRQELTLQEISQSTLQNK